MRHELKTWPEQFEAVLRGEKGHEVRRVRDRRFAVGDVLCLREWRPEDGLYTGRELEVVVTNLTHPGEFGLPDDVCVMSVRKAVPLPDEAKPKWAADGVPDCTLGQCLSYVPSHQSGKVLEAPRCGLTGDWRLAVCRFAVRASLHRPHPGEDSAGRWDLDAGVPALLQHGDVRQAGAHRG